MSRLIATMDSHAHKTFVMRGREDVHTNSFLNRLNVTMATAVALQIIVRRVPAFQESPSIVMTAWLVLWTSAYKAKRAGRFV